MSINRIVEPASGEIMLKSMAEPERRSLENGIPIYSIHGGTQEICKIEFVFYAGSWHQKKPLVSVITNALLKEGTKTKSSQEISQKLDYYGAFLEHYATPDTSVVALYTLNKHLAHTIPVFTDLISNAIFPEKEFQLLLDQHRNQYKISKKKVEYVASRQFRTLLFGKTHPYGNEVDESSFDTLKHSDIFDFYNSYYTQQNARIIVSGYVIPEIADTLNNTLCQTLPQGNLCIPITDGQTHSNGSKELYIEMDDVVQSAIRMGCITITREHPDFPMLEIAVTILGGYFGSRLMRNIREDKGYTYGIGARVIPLKAGSFLSIATEVAVDITSSAVEEIKKELKKLRTEPISTEELALVKNHLRGNILRGFDGPFAQAERFRELSDIQLDFSYYKNVIQTIDKATPSTIQLIAEKYLHEDLMFTVIAGKK